MLFAQFRLQAMAPKRRRPSVAERSPKAKVKKPTTCLKSSYKKVHSLVAKDGSSESYTRVKTVEKDDKVMAAIKKIVPAHDLSRVFGHGSN